MTSSPTRERASLFQRGWQMGLNLTTTTESLLTWLGMWGAMRGFCPLTAAILVSVALLESLTPPVTRLFGSVPVNLIHVFAVGIGLLLGVIGYFAGDSWDLLFEAFYGPKGKWVERVREPLLVFPAGATLNRHRSRASQVLPRKADTANGIYKDAVKLARRQVERWEGIERPLILSRFMRGLLWPFVFATILALAGAVIFPLVGAATEAPRLLRTGGVCLILALVCLAPYSHLRVEHMIRLYQDVAGHLAKKRGDRH